MWDSAGSAKHPSDVLLFALVEFSRDWELKVTSRPEPLYPVPPPKRCPVCGFASYSSEGIHPQCSVRQADAVKHAKRSSTFANPFATAVKFLPQPEVTRDGNELGDIQLASAGRPCPVDCGAEEKRARRKKRKEADGAASDAPATDPEMHSEANKATTHVEQTDTFRKDVNNE
jgi:hypothetical protein